MSQRKRFKTKSVIAGKQLGKYVRFVGLLRLLLRHDRVVRANTVKHLPKANRRLGEFSAGSSCSRMIMQREKPLCWQRN